MKGQGPYGALAQWPGAGGMWPAARPQQFRPAGALLANPAEPHAPCTFAPLCLHRCCRRPRPTCAPAGPSAPARRAPAALWRRGPARLCRVHPGVEQRPAAGRVPLGSLARQPRTRVEALARHALGTGARLLAADLAPAAGEGGGWEQQPLDCQVWGERVASRAGAAAFAPSRHSKV